MATMTRVLPWRRHVDATEPATARLVEAFRTKHPRASADKIKRAFELARVSHGEQLRKSGEPYVTHPLEVATIAARLGMDEVTVVGALLHDVVEDTDVTLAEVEELFGSEIAHVVDGVTKLDGVKFYSKEEQQAATMRKLLFAIAQDVRVLIIKLCDRLHNMTTLAVLPPEKQARIAQETLEVFAPLAHRLGMQEVKTQLEDLAFATLHPKWFAEIDQMVATRTPERDLYLTQVVADVEQRLAELNITADVTGRPKHLWSIYEKMVVRGRSFDEIFDLVGIRLVVDDVRDCYAALGTIHSTWKPVQGRFKDYIAMPKFNLYQSLHTTVVGPQGKPLEVQIRTREMHARAENGVAAHWDYKATNPGRDSAWMARIAEFDDEVGDPGEFMANLKFDLQQDEVFVFTPKGEVVTLATGSTPVDFAYAIHTEIGHRCIGARVNGVLVPLDTTLESGNSIEVITSKVDGAGPGREWLDFVVTPRAANRIKSWHTKADRVDSIEAGRDELTRELRRQGVPVAAIVDSPRFGEVARALNYADTDALFVALGQGTLPVKVLVTRLASSLKDARVDADEMLATSLTGTTHKRRGPGVQVEGCDDVMVRLGKCCSPLPPDDIVAFETRGRGVVVHRTDCVQFAEAVELHRHRQLEADWVDDPDARYALPIEVRALDRPALLLNVAEVMVDHGLNIVGAKLKVGADRAAIMRFDVEMADVSHLDSLLGKLVRVDGVYRAHRVLPSSSDEATAVGEAGRSHLVVPSSSDEAAAVGEAGRSHRVVPSGADDV